MSEETSLSRVPPQNLEAEMAVLGSMLIDNEAIPNVLEVLVSDFLYGEQNRKIFEAISKLYSENKAVDILTVSA